MLVLKRKTHEKIQFDTLDGVIELFVSKIEGKSGVSIAISAPSSVCIRRDNAKNKTPKKPIAFTQTSLNDYLKQRRNIKTSTSDQQ